MKFMKLGSKPDTFFTAESARSISSEVASDLVVQVKGQRYLLHKFPLLSKCLLLQKLYAESPDSFQRQTVQIPDFPVSLEAFELCAKFCYGITITLSAHNLLASWRAAEYLQMTQALDKGNLACKIEVFFNSCILHGWKDSIVTLKSTKPFHSWCEKLNITGRCIDAIAAKAPTRPSKASANGDGGSKSWWGEDIAELGIDLYWRTMIAIKSGGKVSPVIIGNSLQIYASRWFPTKQSVSIAKERNSKHKFLLESIVSLLPSEKGCVPCSFLLKLLKAGIILGASSSSKMELARRAGIQLDEARVKDLLIPSSSQAKGTTKYDIDIVVRMLEEFKSHVRERRSRSMENVGMEVRESRGAFSASHSAKLKVAKLIDEYLMEMAHDVNFPLSRMIEIAESVPEFARIDHDDLYRAINTYMKAHPDLSKSERKSLCKILNCKKLSMDACMHAARNELLPLRVVVQVLFYEQARAAVDGGKVSDFPANIKALLVGRDDDDDASSMHLASDQWSVSGPKSPSRSKLTTLGSNLPEGLMGGPDGPLKTSKLRAPESIPGRPKRMPSRRH